MRVPSGQHGRAFAPRSSLTAADRGGPGHAILPVFPSLSRTVPPPAVTDRVSDGRIGLVLHKAVPHALDAATAAPAYAPTELAQRDDDTLANPSPLIANRSRAPPPSPSQPPPPTDRTAR